MNFYDRLNFLIKEKRLSQGKVEKELGFSNGSISKWKKYNPNAEKVQLLARYFGVTVDYLMTGSDSKYSDNDALLDVRISEDKELKEALKKYYALDEQKKRHVIETINMLSEV